MEAPTLLRAKTGALASPGSGCSLPGAAFHCQYMEATSGAVHKSFPQGAKIGPETEAVRKQIAFCANGLPGDSTSLFRKPGRAAQVQAPLPSPCSTFGCSSVII